MKNKRIIPTLIVLGIIFTIMGGSLAYYNWQTSSSQQTKVTFTANASFSCSADGGGDITSGQVNLVPTSCTNETYAIKREVTVNTVLTNQGENIMLDLWLNVDILDTGLKDSTNFKYALTKGSTSCTDEKIIEGNFNGKVQNDKVKLLDGKIYSTSKQETYYLWIWLDSAETSTSTMNQNFKLSLGGECTDNVKPNAPVLDNTGMIPVTITNNGTVTTISNTDPNWYDYSEKKWANAVLVKNDNDETAIHGRTYYQNNPNQTVEPSDILAYYVWIPRYKYKIWTLGTGSTPQEIKIAFEPKDETTTGSEADDYITHPAFDFGGEKLPGFWAAKFEISADSNSTCYKNASSADNCNNLNQEPRILPSVHALNNIKIGYMFET